jgi:two-component system, LytTR family, sensor kinase
MSAAKLEVSDLWPRVLLSPPLGALVATGSGLIDASRHSVPSLLATYAYFSLVAFLIWTGNSCLYVRLPRRDDWLHRPSSRLTVLLTSIVAFSIPAAWILISTWRYLTGDPGVNAYAVPIAILAIVTVVVIITHVYETVFLLRDWESDRLRTARLEQARLEAELEALGREVDPHFLFNNLNALAHLIDEQKPGASTFISALGDTYRYVLDSRGRHLVPLARELDSLRRHETLATIRFGAAIALRLEVSEEDSRRAQLPPVALGELFQNAIKHNAIGPELPLTIVVSVEDGTLVFRNTVRARRTDRGSLGIGLRNLSERFRLATGREVTWGPESDEGEWFVVRLPLLQ